MMEVDHVVPEIGGCQHGGHLLVHSWPLDLEERERPPLAGECGGLRERRHQEAVRPTGVRWRWGAAHSSLGFVPDHSIVDFVRSLA